MPNVFKGDTPVKQISNGCDPKGVGREPFWQSCPPHPTLDHLHAVAFGHTAIGPCTAFPQAERTRRVWRCG